MVFNVITLIVVALIFIVCCCIHQNIAAIQLSNVRIENVVNGLYKKSSQKQEMDRFIPYLTICTQYQLVSARIMISQLMSDAVSQDKFELAQQFQELLNVLDDLIDNAPNIEKAK